MNRTFSIKTLGCKLNQYESALLAERLKEQGWEVRPYGERVDLVIVNTCAVTDRSEKKCRNYIRQGARFAADGKVMVTGCMVHKEESLLSRMPEVGELYPNSGKEDIPGVLAARFSAGPVSFPEAVRRAPRPLFRTRGYLKIQDGCGGACSYCIVPSVRGGPVSRSAGEVLAEAESLVRSGCPEIVFTGITIGKYLDRGLDLAGLAREVIGIPGPFRLRITSIEPEDVTPDLLSLFRTGRVCRHIHLPLQSGSDRVLKLMNRNYTRAQYLAVVDRIRATDPDMAIGTDIILGFPGETEADFRDSLDMVSSCGFSSVHQFSFSPRSGTPAADMAQEVTAAGLDDRSARMRQLAADTGLSYRKRFEGKTLECVPEGRRGGVTALSDNYIPIALDSRNSVPQGLVNVVLLRAGLERNTGVLAGDGAGAGIIQEGG